MTAWWQRHRLAAAIGLEIAAIALTLIGAAVLSALLPGLPGYSVTGPSHSLVLVIVLAVAVLAVIGLMRWWRLTGFTPPSQWRQPQLFVLPIVLLPAPFIAGVHPLPAITVGLLLAYLATAVYEESLWRGAILALEPHIPAARVLARHPHHQGDQQLVDPGPSGQVRVGPSSANEAAMPAQDRVGATRRWRRSARGNRRTSAANTARSASPSAAVGCCGAGWRPCAGARGAQRPCRRTCGTTAGPTRGPAGSVKYSNRNDTP